MERSRRKAKLNNLNSRPSTISSKPTGTSRTCKKNKQRLKCKEPVTTDNSTANKVPEESEDPQVDLDNDTVPVHMSINPGMIRLNTEEANDEPNVDNMNGNSKDEDSGTQEARLTPLTMSQRAQIEVNRQKALLIRQEKINKRKLYEKVEEEPEKQKIIRVNNTKLIDTGGGFFIEEKSNELSEEDVVAAMDIVTEPAPLLGSDQPFCDECSQPFDNSYLMHNFDEPICDGCRDREDKHALITKTDAKENYFLKDGDFDCRDPPLKYILRKNPHNSHWGDMKLYLKLQIEKRALEIWETEDALEEAIQIRDDKRKSLKQKRFMNKMKELRMDVRSSLYTRATKTHQHEYGDEVYHSDDDEYSKTCATCGHTYKYDKM